ncbi:EAL domain-containing protein [Escherichia coli]|nr:EAL domain-containing protein [Escherichia coli]MCC4099593.1 EAL domain-containing protein [Escherichia coli]
MAGSSPSLPDGSNPSAAIVQSASDVQCSRLLKTTMEVVAEGVETPDCLAWLRQAGCDTVQGFLFARPMPAAAFVGFVNQWRNTGTVAKLAMRQPFVLFKGLTFQKLCLPGAFRPGDHHNKMLRPGLCVVHASPQYL